MADLPSFEALRASASRMLKAADDELRSSFAPGTGPTPAQREDVKEARQLIAMAKAALERASG